MNSNILNEFLRKTGIGIKELVKAMVIASLINFVVMAIGFKIAKVPYYILIALIVGIFDLLPVVGGGVILIPWAIIALVSGNVSQGLILIVVYLITLVLKQIVEPIILGKGIGLKSIYTLIITIVSMIVLTPGIGAIVGAILSIIVAVVIDMKKTYGKPKMK